MTIKRIPVVALLALIVLGGFSCEPSKKKTKSRYDHLDGGIPPVTPECLAPADKCWADCFKRDASIVCGGCCHEQQFLCDIKRPHSFDYCKSAQ